jgi:hypothetical protein
MARWTPLAVVLLFVVTVIAVPGTSLAATRTISSATSATYTVGNEDYDIFTFSSAAGRLTARVSGISGGPIDVYVLTSSQLSDYQNPMADSFGYEELKERISSSTTVSTTLTSSVHLVVDNAYISASGAVPSGSASYTVTFEVSTGPDPALIGGAVLFLIILIAVVAVVSRSRRRKRALNSPVVAPPPGYGAPGYGGGAPGYGVQPPQYGQGSYGGGTAQYGQGAYAGGTAQYGQGTYAGGTAQYASPAYGPGQPSYAPPPAAAPPASAPASSSNMAPCPYCSAPMAFYAAKCPSCGMDISWS